MMHREPPEAEPDREIEAGPAPGRRFARMVGSPAGRRVAFPRLLAAGAIALVLLALVAVGGSWLLRSATRWVDLRPEHRITFAQIELSPPPDPWVVGGSARILEEVREGARLDESLPLLDLDLKAIERDFRRCSWVKDVLRVDRTHYGRLVVELAYRKPVAFVRLDLEAPNAFVIDEEAVVLPDGDIRWTSDRQPFLVRGSVGTLFEIRGLPASTPRPRFGVPWKRKVEGDSLDDRDPMILKAARLALFLASKRPSSDAARGAPDFVTIYLPDGPDHPFYLIDAGRNLVKLGKAPGDEGAGDLAPEARWAMLLDWTRTNGPLDAKHPNYLEFTRDGAKLVVGRKPGR